MLPTGIGPRFSTPGASIPCPYNSQVYRLSLLKPEGSYWKTLSKIAMIRSTLSSGPSRQFRSAPASSHWASAQRFLSTEAGSSDASSDDSFFRSAPEGSVPSFFFVSSLLLGLWISWLLTGHGLIDFWTGTLTPDQLAPQLYIFFSKF